MRFVCKFGIDKSDYVKQFILLGAIWSYDEETFEWIEIHILGFRFFFAFDD